MNKFLILSLVGLLLLNEAVSYRSGYYPWYTYGTTNQSHFWNYDVTDGYGDNFTVNSYSPYQYHGYGGYGGYGQQVAQAGGLYNGNSNRRNDGNTQFFDEMVERYYGLIPD